MMKEVHILLENGHILIKSSIFLLVLIEWLMMYGSFSPQKIYLFENGFLGLLGLGDHRSLVPNKYAFS